VEFLVFGLAQQQVIAMDTAAGLSAVGAINIVSVGSRYYNTTFKTGSGNARSSA
jgi:hypothetical protein